MFFFFKQKTAYEMRISDWSSDVCSSDLMRESNRIIRQCVEWLRNNSGPVIVDNHKVAPPSREHMKTGMEDLIHHFKLFTEGMHVPAGETYAAEIGRASCRVRVCQYG